MALKTAKIIYASTQSSGKILGIDEFGTLWITEPGIKPMVWTYMLHSPQIEVADEPVTDNPPV